MGKHSGGSFGGSRSSSHGGHHHGGSHFSHGGHHHHYGSHYGSHHHHGGYHHYGGGSTTIRCSPLSCLVFIVIAVVGGIILIGLLAAPWNKSSTVNLGLLETYIIAPSTTWKKEVTLTSDSFGFVTAYKFAKTPPLDPEKKTKNEQQVVNVPYNSFDSQAYYLIAGSVLTVNFTASRNVEFFVLKGTSQFARWRNNEQVTYVYQSYTSDMPNQKFTMTSTDDIYLIWRNLQSQTEITGEAFIEIEMVSYDLSNPLQVCTFNQTCVMPLAKGSSEVVAITAALSGDQNQQFQVDYQISGRLDYYFAIFGGVVAACIVLGFFIFLIGLFIRRRNSYTQM